MFIYLGFLSKSSPFIYFRSLIALSQSVHLSTPACVHVDLSLSDYAFILRVFKSMRDYCLSLNIIYIFSLPLLVSITFVIRMRR